MRILLINDNPAVSRLITLSVEKMGHEIKEVLKIEDYDGTKCDLVFIDSESYEEEVAKTMKEMELFEHFSYIAPRGEEKPDIMDSMLEKPFLPTDFMNLFEKISSSLLSGEKSSTLVLSSREIDEVKHLLEDDDMQTPDVIEDASRENESEESYPKEGVSKLAQGLDAYNQSDTDESTQEYEHGDDLESKELDLLDESLDDDTLDDELSSLNEDSLMDVLGEKNSVQNQHANQIPNKEQIQKELEKDLIQWLSGVLNSDKYNEALKDFKINISIGFEAK